MILTNAEVGMSMSDLEIRARRGCPFAQEELQRQSMRAANLLTDLRRKERLNMAEAIKETKLG